MRKYETIMVIDTLLKPEEIKGIISKYERFISANGGIVEDTQAWGKRRLAYEIKKRQYGFYVMIRFEAPSSMIKQLDREYRLNEFLLRTMITKLDKKALAAIAKQPPLPPTPTQTGPIDEDNPEEVAESLAPSIQPEATDEEPFTETENLF